MAGILLTNSKLGTWQTCSLEGAWRHLKMCLWNKSFVQTENCATLIPALFLLQKHAHKSIRPITWRTQKTTHCMDHSVCQSHENHGASCLCKLHAMLMLVLIIFHQVARGPLIFHVQMERRQWAYGSCRMVILHIANSCRTWPRNFYSWPKALLWLFCATSVVSAKMDPGYLLGMFFF